jgi:hypothetical protein
MWAVFITSALREAEIKFLEVSEEQSILQYDTSDHFKI